MLRSVLSGLSSMLSYLQVEDGHPCWQYPQGTKSHDPQPCGLLGARLGSIEGTLDELGILLGDADGCALGALLRSSTHSTNGTLSTTVEPTNAVGASSAVLSCAD